MSYSYPIWFGPILESSPSRIVLLWLWAIYNIGNTIKFSFLLIWAKTHTPKYLNENLLYSTFIKKFKIQNFWVFNPFKTKIPLDWTCTLEWFNSSRQPLQLLQFYKIFYFLHILFLLFLVLHFLWFFTNS